jgi:NADPH-dependent 2,4-dienoyl-CoA reductase/sulfur reductase-like enzyme
VIATGAVPIRPPIAGLDLPGVYLLHTMEDSFRIHEHVTGRHPKSVLIVGGGYIGLEMVDALRHRGIQVTLVEMAKTLLPATVDYELGRIIENELQRHGVEVVLQVAIESIQLEGSNLAVSGSQGFQRTVDLVLVVVGVRPNSDLAVAAGIQTGVRGAISVNHRMETSASDIYAAGDCVETWHRVTNQNTYLPLGTTAHKQG